jgi:MOSC domain-containing protein YiiM
VTGRPAGTLASINVSRGGVPKRPVPEATVTAAGLLGDRQADGRYHGGPERAVTLFSRERIDRLRAEGHPIDVGTTGENLTVAGLDWDRVKPPVRVRVGAVELEVTKFASPCEKIAASFRDADFLRLSEKRHPGWSRVCAKVLREGPVRAGDVVELLGPPGQGSGPLA